MKFLAIVFLILSSLPALAQKSWSTYHKDNDRVVLLRDSAEFIRTITAPDSGKTLYDVKEYYLNGNIKLKGKYVRQNLYRLEDSCFTYFPSGQLKSKSVYRNGLLVDKQYLYYPNGKPYITYSFPSAPDATQRLNTFIPDIIAAFGLDNKATVDAGNGYLKIYDSDFKQVTEEGSVKEGKKNGLWKGVDNGLNLRFSETYATGQLIKGTSVSALGDSVIYDKLRYQEPVFPDGLPAFYRYVGKTVKYPDYAVKNEISGTVILSFVVEKNGTLSDIEVYRPANPYLDAEAIRVLKTSPLWLPGKRYGRIARVNYILPIVFKLQ